MHLANTVVGKASPLHIAAHAAAAKPTALLSVGRAVFSSAVALCASPTAPAGPLDVQPTHSSISHVVASRLCDIFLSAYPLPTQDISMVHMSASCPVLFSARRQCWYSVLLFSGQVPAKLLRKGPSRRNGDM